MKKILFAASECVPFIKTGGLADVCGALPKTFDHKDWDVRVVIPNYSCIPEKYRSQFEYVTHFYMACGSYIPSKYVGVLQYKLDGVTYYFIDNQEYFNCFVPYGDMRYDIEKFTFFDKAVLSMLPLIGFRPDIEQGGRHMRVIAGTARRLPLVTPKGMETRPTTDRIKETLFNILQNDLPGCHFLDLFAGSGAIGIEALSRGAAKAVFVDNSKEALSER